MAEETPKDASATFYRMKAMNRWFLVSVALLTWAYLLSVYKDHFREWKGSQREFMEIERETAIAQGAVVYKATVGQGRKFGPTPSMRHNRQSVECRGAGRRFAPLARLQQGERGDEVAKATDIRSLRR